MRSIQIEHTKSRYKIFLHNYINASSGRRYGRKKDEGQKIISLYPVFQGMVSTKYERQHQYLNVSPIRSEP